MFCRIGNATSQITVAIIDTEPSSPNADHSTSTMSRNPDNSSTSKDPIGKQENNATSITQTQPPSSPATPGPSIDETTNQNSPEILDFSNLSTETPPSQSADSPSTPGTSLTQNADKDLKDLAKYLSSPLKPHEESDSPQKEAEKPLEKDSLTVKEGKSKDGATAQKPIDMTSSDGDGQLAQAVKRDRRTKNGYNLRNIDKNKAKNQPSLGGGDDGDDFGDGSDDDNDSGLSSNDDDSSNENEDDSAYVDNQPKKKKQRKVKTSKSTDDEREKAESYEKIRKRIAGDWNNFFQR